MGFDILYRVMNKRQGCGRRILFAGLMFPVFLAGCEHMKGYRVFWKQRQLQEAFEQNPNADIVRYL